MRDRLIELMQEWGNTCTDSFPFESVADHLLANGVIVLPCKVGDTLYDISEFVKGIYSPEIYEIKDNKISIEKDDDGKYRFIYDCCYIYPEEIGKTLFFTEEDAIHNIAALKGGAE